MSAEKRLWLILFAICFPLFLLSYSWLSPLLVSNTDADPVACIGEDCSSSVNASEGQGSDTLTVIMGVLSTLSSLVASGVAVFGFVITWRKDQRQAQKDAIFLERERLALEKLKEPAPPANLPFE